MFDDVRQIPIIEAVRGVGGEGHNLEEIARGIRCQSRHNNFPAPPFGSRAARFRFLKQIAGHNFHSGSNCSAVPTAVCSIPRPPPLLEEEG